MKEINSKPGHCKRVWRGRNAKVTQGASGGLLSRTWHRGFREAFLQVLMADKGEVNRVNQRVLDIPGRGNRMGKDL